MLIKIKSLDTIRMILADRGFTTLQVDKVVPKLNKGYIKEPDLLAEIIDCWNTVMGTAKLEPIDQTVQNIRIPSIAAPSKDSIAGRSEINMNTVLADVEPDLLNFHPKKLIQRHQKVQGLGVTQNMNENWLLLYNAPRGFYLQDWTNLTKKILYIEHKVLDLLYLKKELKEMLVHPIVKCAAVTETNYDHIRARYLFALRIGYRELAQMYDVSTSTSTLGLRELILSDDKTFLEKFAPHCSIEEYICFSKLIEKHDIDCDDSEIFEDMAELESLKYEAWPKSLKKQDLRDAISRQKERRANG